jgi:hypothetical protein
MHPSLGVSAETKIRFAPTSIQKFLDHSRRIVGIIFFQFVNLGFGENKEKQHVTS